LVPEAEIAAVVARLGREITADYRDKNPLLVAVLKGAFVFMADLIRHIEAPCGLDFMAVSSYGGGTRTSGEVRIIKDLDTNIRGRHVIIVEDILDSGLTLSRLLELLAAREPASLAVCALFDKPERRQAEVRLSYCGMQVPDAFIVGYGLDYDERYRNLPDVGVLKPRVYENA
jgi:hypoxanthine phosphoribosyltransferase